MGECRCSSKNSNSRHYIEGNGQHRSPAVLPVRENPTLSIELEIGWDLTLSKRVIKEQNVFVPQDADRPTCSLFIISTAQSFKVQRVTSCQPFIPFCFKDNNNRLLAASSAELS